LLGSGGFASVYARGDQAVKVAHASHDLARARMAREAEAMRAIGGGAVPQLIDSGDSPTPWIAMERIVGTNFADICADGIKAHEAVPLGVAILDALEKIHAAKFVHRDLKPDNLVRVGDRVVILDLGLARRIPTDPDDPNRANVQVGSLEYMAPEQIADSARVDERSDIYAFGCILYELIAGRPPFIGDAQILERAHTALRPPRLNALVTVPAAVDALVADCLAKDPARRPQTVAEVKGRLVVSRDERTPPKLQHSMSVIREGKQPVVLLWAELPRVDRALLGALTGRRLMIASQRGRKVLAAVLGGEHADPAAVAIATARDLVAAGARVALHLEALRVASGTLQGEPVEKPETWLPSGAWTGVVLTAPLAAVTHARTVDGPPGFRVLTDETHTVELVGREALLTDLVSDAAVALYGGAEPAEPGRRARRGSSMSGVFGPQGPGFALLVGDPGTGKTAFIGELARRLRELGVRVHVGTVPPPGTGKTGASALADLVGPMQGVRALGDAIRAAAHDTATAILLDDLHLAEHELFDALEYATLGGESLPLWIIATAAPRIDARRPNLGDRAQRHRRDVLTPLDEDAAVALTAALLRPAEYPPLRALRRLSTIAHGNPLHLVMLAREIHQRGAIRERAGGAYFLDTSALDELSPVALGPWLAARELAGLGDELAALARLCAVLGGEVTRDELVAIVEAAERQGGATTTIDVDIGLRELVTAGVLMQTAHGYGFRQALVEEGVYATTNEDERRALHRTALSTLTLSPATAERVAHHADALDDHAAAARAYAVLGERAIAQHRPLDADQNWSAALRHSPDASPARMQALMMRAEARYRTQRVRDALVDLEQAGEIAEALGDRDVQARIELQRATALDWADDWDGSAAAAARARELLGDTPSVDADLAEARSLFRAGKFDEAQPRLAAVRVAAREQHKSETEIIARLLESTALVDLGRYDEATRAFDELIPLCKQNDDRFHLGVAYANRSWLWSVQGETERCNEDLRTVIQLAREIGHAQVERIATYNLGEALLWQSSLDEALRLARRSESLQLGHGEGAAKLDQLLIARVLAARGDTADLAHILQTLANQALSPNEQAMLDILHGGRWEDLLRSEHLTVENKLELGQLALRAGVLDEDRRKELAALQAAHPLWSKLPVSFL
jgi:tetratricopeptide (TPR) repeat protein